MNSFFISDRRPLAARRDTHSMTTMAIRAAGISQLI
jgi:hypothetical protein